MDELEQGTVDVLAVLHSMQGQLQTQREKQAAHIASTQRLEAKVDRMHQLLAASIQSLAGQGMTGLNSNAQQPSPRSPHGASVRGGKAPSDKASLNRIGARYLEAADDILGEPAHLEAVQRQWQVRESGVGGHEMSLQEWREGKWKVSAIAVLHFKRATGLAHSARTVRQD